MKLQINQVKTTVDQGSEYACEKIAEQFGISLNDVWLAKTSVDGRKGEVSFSSTVVFQVEDSVGEKLLEKGVASLAKTGESQLPKIAKGNKTLDNPPVVIGFGPAGMFAALLLAREGYRPIVLERGGDMDSRVQAVEKFWSGGGLNSQSNVQFGEGGAGTFSDGKLTTRISDPLCNFILKEMVAFGAPKEILIKAKPHVGSDLLRNIVKNIRKEIISLGGEVRFLSKVEEFQVSRNRIKGLSCNGESLGAQATIVAVGHSARDTFFALEKAGAALTSKPFSVGVRIEHLQSEIDKALYHSHAGHKNLPAGEYQLSHRVGEKAAYTFCMCPGGLVVASASEQGQTVTNGMSYSARNGKNANSALVASVDSSDFGTGWQNGINFQRKLEEKAFILGGANGHAPFMKVGDFLKTSSSLALPVEPSYRPGVTEKNLREVLPKEICSRLEQAMPIMARKLRGFDSPGAVLTGVETRTSSPVRIPRNDELMCSGIEGLYPCGEGAGYAGGIMSAAVDGLKVAIKLMEHFSPSV